MAVRPLIGARDLVYALLDESSDVLNGTPTYQTIYPLPNLKRVSVNPNSSGATLFADDGPRVSAETMGEIDVEVELAQIDPADEARILGHTYTNGTIVRNVSDQSPYLAIGFKLLRAGKNGSDLVYDYFWLYKGKFLKPSQDNTTKEDKINYQIPKLVGKFVARQADSLWMIKARTDDSNVSAATLSGFFSAVPSQSADLTALTVTLSEGTAGNAGKIKAVFAKGSGLSFNIDASTLTTDKFSCTLAAGGVVAGTFSAPSAGTSVTVYFTPTTPFGSAAAVGVMLEGVKDTSGIPVTQNGKVITTA